MLGRTPALAARWTIGVGPRRLEQRLDPLSVADVELDQPAARVRQRGGQVRLLDRAGVERVEVVDHDHLMAVAQQAVDQVRSDEPGAAGHDDPHSTTSSQWNAGVRPSTTRATPSPPGSGSSVGGAERLARVVQDVALTGPLWSHSTRASTGC